MSRVPSIPLYKYRTDPNPDSWGGFWICYPDLEEYDVEIFVDHAWEIETAAQMVLGEWIQEHMETGLPFPPATYNGK